MEKMDLGKLNNFLGDIDLFLLDQILKGLFENHQRILDVGCGEGRNLIYFIQSGFEVHGVDQDKSSIDLCKFISKELGYYPDRFNQAQAEDLPFDSGSMDVVLSSRVFHFSEDNDHFLTCWAEIIRVLKPGGILYLTMDSMIGMDAYLKKIDDFKWQFPDGSVRFMLNEKLISNMKVGKHFKWIEPIKTIIYGGRHSESVLILEKL